ncbi:MAG TPA: hypothetical protein VJ719_03720 [Chthoniobacterales bacterium]|nr:hypothetical protein [Chthoniobacterales bacterium]
MLPERNGHAEALLYFGDAALTKTVLENYQMWCSIFDEHSHRWGAVGRQYVRRVEQRPVMKKFVAELLGIIA